MRQLFTILLSSISILGCAQKQPAKTDTAKTQTKMDINNNNLDTTTLGTGCFWCTEAIFQQVNGVVNVTSGYSGGKEENPTYEQVSDKATGHAECLQIVYDTSVVSFDDLLEIFWQVHDPTTLNRQGADVGPQYRSVIFYNNEAEKAKAQNYITQLNASGAYDNPIVTTLEPMVKFYSAESYHQNYYNLNKTQGYCQFVIQPKIDKFKKVFKDKLKK